MRGCFLTDTEEDTQARRRDILQGGAIQDDFFVVKFHQRLYILCRLYSCCRVQTACKRSNNLISVVCDFCFHILLINVNTFFSSTRS